MSSYRSSGGRRDERRRDDYRRRSRSPMPRRSRPPSEERRRSRRESPPRRMIDEHRYNDHPLPPPSKRRVVVVEPPPRRAPVYSSFPGSTTVWIGSVPETASEEEVYDKVVEVAESIEGLRILTQRGFGYIRFESEGSAKNFLERVIENPIVVAGKRTRVDACEDMPTLPHPYRPDMTKKPSACSTLFVGNLPIETGEDELETLFNSQMPETVRVSSISLRRGGYKGLSFAHVRFSSPENCLTAVACVSGSKLRGNRIRIDWAVDKAPETARGTQAILSEDLRGKTTKIYIGNLNECIQENDLLQYMQQFGLIHSVKLHKDKSGHRSFGYVVFESPESAANAIENTTHLVINGVKLRTDFARPERSTPSILLNDGNLAQKKSRSPSPDLPRATPVSFHIPAGYGPMRSWIECYGDSMLNGTA